MCVVVWCACVVVIVLCACVFVCVCSCLCAPCVKNVFVCYVSGLLSDIAWFVCAFSCCVVCPNVCLRVLLNCVCFFVNGYCAVLYGLFVLCVFYGVSV